MPFNSRDGPAGAAISEKKKTEIEAAIKADRDRLERDKDMAEEERNRVLAHMEHAEAQISKSESEKSDLKKKLEALEKKVIVGIRFSSFFFQNCS